jgi:hypothetical protein
LRQEFVDVVYLVYERLQGFDERRLHQIISQSLGLQPSANPYGGHRYAIGRDVNRVEWQRFYDLVVRISAEVPGSFRTEYRRLVNTLLSGHRIAWDLGDDDQLHRVLPEVVAHQIDTAFRELSASRFESALTSFRQGIAAYDDRPQRGRDACKNIFDAVEAVAKELYGMPTRTFGDVMAEIRRRQVVTTETLGSLQKLYDLANNHFRHGLTTPFSLRSAEVDYVLVNCVGAILLLIRL